MLNERIENLLQLKSYIIQNSEAWQTVKLNAERMNGWFTQAFIEMSLSHICKHYLDENELIVYASQIETAEEKGRTMTIGITMAGNIPLVGFHDFLTVYLSGHTQRIKLSSKDNVLLTHLIEILYTLDDKNKSLIIVAEMLKNCDAYIATGSNSSALYFEKYFARFPHIIRKNKTSVAVLNGQETSLDLEQLADDVYQYFGLGCRNVSKVFVPQGYDFVPLLKAFNKYDHLKNHNKYRNNYDYHLAIFILNNQYYMSNESLLLSENESNYSSIAVLNYSYYTDTPLIEHQEEIQAIIGVDYIPFGKAQTPTLTDFADGVNTIQFLNSL
ncbi:MAG: acyl-CoA reductase [Bacteroidetes bacterium]|jgi:hypothetical protein|nr:acyl-CoA reductase [Bacteroidota bacterium]HQW46986.1 acyl-CoA reductase [Chitinophagaceae bacterium]